MSRSFHSSKSWEQNQAAVSIRWENFKSIPNILSSFLVFCQHHEFVFQFCKDAAFDLKISSVLCYSLCSMFGNELVFRDNPPFRADLGCSSCKFSIHILIGKKEMGDMFHWKLVHVLDGYWLCSIYNELEAFRNVTFTNANEQNLLISKTSLSLL